MAIRTELTVRLQNSPGTLARVAEALAEEHVNILALVLEASGVVRLLVDNPLHAAGTLRERHHQVEERSVLYTLAPNDPGALARVARLIADAGINIEYAYVTAVEGHSMAAIVVGVPDAQRASAAAGI